MKVGRLIDKYRRLRDVAREFDARVSLERFCDKVLGDLDQLPREPGIDRRVTTDEVAEIEGVSPETVARWCREGRYPNAERTNGDAGRWTIPIHDIARDSDPATEVKRLYERNGT